MKKKYQCIPLVIKITLPTYPTPYSNQEIATPGSRKVKSQGMAFKAKELWGHLNLSN